MVITLPRHPVVEVHPLIFRFSKELMSGGHGVHDTLLHGIKVLPDTLPVVVHQKPLVASGSGLA